MAHASDVFFHGATLGARLQDFRETRAERRAHARRYRTTLNELRALTDRELADIGISRANIPYIAEMSADRDA